MAHRLDDGDLAAVVRAANALRDSVSSHDWPVPAMCDFDIMPPHSLGSPSSVFSPPPFPSAFGSWRNNCRASPGLHLQRSFSAVPAFGPEGEEMISPSRHGQGRTQILPSASCTLNNLDDGMSTSSLHDGLLDSNLDDGMPTSSLHDGLLDSISSSCCKAGVRVKKEVKTEINLPQGGIDAAPKFRSTTIFSAADILRSYLNREKENDCTASIDEPKKTASSPTALSKVSAWNSSTPEQLTSKLLGSPVRNHGLSSNKVEQASLSEQGSLLTKSSSLKDRRGKRGRPQQRRVVCVPASEGTGRPAGECLLNDRWAWRKYGQKPIKGSPHPRNYYRCSSSKGCPARKQVERSRSDPSMLVVTYLYEHSHPWPTHRNALAGSTRQSSFEKQSTGSPEHAHTTGPSPSSEPSTGDETAVRNLVDSAEEAGEQVDSSVALDIANVDEAAFADADLHVVSCDNIHDTLFGEVDHDLQEEQLSSLSIMDDRSVEGGICGVVDPYNLFSWSSNSFPSSGRDVFR